MKRARFSVNIEPGSSTERGCDHVAFHLAANPGEPANPLAEVASGGDADLCRQVELLLAKGEEAGSFLETPAMAVTETATAAVVGRQFGPYRIVSPLGAGGMGELYRARDSKLHRDVAIKILPSEFARNPDRLARFRREARALASLNHPNICTVFDIGEQDNNPYLVMELLEGETVKDRVAHGALPADEIVQYGIEICDALGALSKPIMRALRSMRSACSRRCHTLSWLSLSDQ